MALPYWTKADLEARIGAEAVRQIFDDANTGIADEDAIAQLSADCDSFVEGYLRPIYNLDDVRDAAPNQVKRLSLDYAEARCARRHPEYVRRDWKEIEASVKDELMLIRRNIVRLDIEGAPEPMAPRGD